MWMLWCLIFVSIALGDPNAPFWGLNDDELRIETVPHQAPSLGEFFQTVHSKIFPRWRRINATNVSPAENVGADFNANNKIATSFMYSSVIWPSRKDTDGKSLEWCSSNGALGAANRAIENLMSKPISYQHALSVKNKYFAARSNERARQLKEAEEAESIATSNIPPQTLSMESLLSWMKIAPVLLDLLSTQPLSPASLHGESNNSSEKLQKLAQKICSLSDAEFETSTESQGANQEDAAVLTCFINDLFAAALMCSTQPLTFSNLCQMNRNHFGDSSFPNKKCYANKESLQARGRNVQAFEFDDPKLSLPLYLVDIFGTTQNSSWSKGQVWRLADTAREEPATEKMLPAEIPMEIQKVEKLTYLTLFRAVMLSYATALVPLASSAKCTAKDRKKLALVPGWDLRYVIGMEEPEPTVVPNNENEQHATRQISIPLVYLSTRAKRQPCEFLILFRGTSTTFEWLQGLSYWQSILSLPSGKQFAVHGGYLKALNQLLPQLEAWLEGYASTCFTTTSNFATRFLVTGHSMGAALGQLLSIYLADRFRGARIDGVFFAPPRVFGEEAGEKFASTVNGRVLVDVSDGLFYLPCFSENAKHGFGRCPRNHILAPGAGRDYYTENFGIVKSRIKFKFPRGSPNSLFATLRNSTAASAFGPVIGSLFQTAAKSSVFSGLPTYEELSAAHVCAFACDLSDSSCNSNIQDLSDAGSGDTRFRWWCEDCPVINGNIYV